MSDNGNPPIFDLAKAPSDREQRAIIERATAALQADSRVLAAWLAGSYARGNADVYSDVDIHCLITDDSADWFRDHWPQMAGEIMPVLMHHSIPGVAGGFVLSPAWQHLDLIFNAVSDFDPEALTEFVPLFDREGRLPAAAAPPQPTVPAVSLSREQIDLYFYIIGNLVVTLGRGEYLVALGGVNGVRDAFLVPVMIAAAGNTRSGGAKRLNPFLGPDHRRFLEQLPAVSAEPESICTFMSILAREYARLAKPVAASSGIEWPTALEQATADHLRKHTGIEIL
jgi:hypothetical protein